MNLPNTITVGRLVLTAAEFVILESVANPEAPSPTLMWVAFTFFMTAALSDFVDGYLARKYGQVTTFGRIADPFADKILICGTFVLLLQFPAAAAILPSWYVVVVLGREFLVTSIRGMAESQGVPFPADRLGKWKMVSQCWTASALLAIVAGATMWTSAAFWGMWVSLALTVVSGLGYVWKARHLLQT